MTTPTLQAFAPGRRPRVCLKCDNPFPSAGPGNRICGRCDDTNRTLSRREHLSPARTHPEHLHDEERT